MQTLILILSLLTNLVLIAKTVKQGIRINDLEWSDEQDRLDNYKRNKK